MTAPTRSGVTLNDINTVSNGKANGQADGHVNGHLPKAKTLMVVVHGQSAFRNLDDSMESDICRVYSGAALLTLTLVRRLIRSSSYSTQDRRLQKLLQYPEASAPGPIFSYAKDVVKGTFPLPHPGAGSNGGASSTIISAPIPGRRGMVLGPVYV